MFNMDIVCISFLSSVIYNYLENTNMQLLMKLVLKVILTIKKRLLMV